MRHKQTDQLSSKGQELVEEAIMRIKFKDSADAELQEELSNAELQEELAKAAAKEMLKPYKDKIERKGLNFQDITELKQKEILSADVTVIETQYPNFCKGRTLSAIEIDELIWDGIIQGVGISRTTCGRFLSGKAINRNAFKIFCKTLGIDYKLVVNRPEIPDEVIVSDFKKQKLKQSLGQFNHDPQWRQFQQFASKTACLPIYIKNPTFETFFSKLLLNCLIIKLSPNNNKTSVFYLSGLKKLSSSPKKGGFYNYSDLLWTQLATELKPFNNSLDVKKVTKNSTATDVIKATASFLKQNHIILIIEPTEGIGNDTIFEIVQQFCQHLVRGINKELEYLEKNVYKLLLCYIDKGNSQIKAIKNYEENWDGYRLIEIEVADVFKKIDLDRWIHDSQVMPLFGSGQNETEIHAKIKEIWGCDRTICEFLRDPPLPSVPPFLSCLTCATQEITPTIALLKTIYKNFNCEWDEDWKKW
jgi:hypothetical protein